MQIELSIENCLFEKAKLLGMYKSNFLKIVKNVIIPLLLGSSIYFLARPNQTFAENLFGWRYNFFHSEQKSWILNIILGSLPDFLWMYSLLYLLVFIWGGLKKIPLFIKLFFYTVPIITEFLQYFKIIFGTADIFDIIAYITAISIFEINYLPKQNKNETKI